MPCRSQRPRCCSETTMGCALVCSRGCKVLRCQACSSVSCGAPGGRRAWTKMGTAPWTWPSSGLPWTRWAPCPQWRCRRCCQSVVASAVDTGAASSGPGLCETRWAAGPWLLGSESASQPGTSGVACARVPGAHGSLLAPGADACVCAAVQLQTALSGDSVGVIFEVLPSSRLCLHSGWWRRSGLRPLCAPPLLSPTRASGVHICVPQSGACAASQPGGACAGHGHPRWLHHAGPVPDDC